MDYQRYLASREWRVRRRSIIERSHGACERCWGPGANQVHHVTYERIGRELPEDLLALCRPCHEYLSAVSDSDPLYAIPTLAGPDDSLMGEGLSRLAQLEEYTGTDDPDCSNPELLKILVDWVVDRVRWVTSVASTRFVASPERTYCIVHASALYGSLHDEDAQLARAVLPLLELCGLEPRPDDPWRRWRLPMVWAERR